MTPTETADILRQFNEWQRGHNTVLRPSSNELGEAIDAAVEMIDRLEAAESECLEEARLNGMGSEREAALLAKLEAAEKEREELHALIAAVKKQADAEFRIRVKKEEACARLQAKIEQMERQAPVAWYSKQYGFVYMSRHSSQFEHGSILYLRNGTPAWRIEGSSKVALLDMASLPHGTVFYALPGAKEPEPTRDWWDCLISDISAIDCMYRGSPTYAHDAYWMRDHVVWMLKKRRDALPGAKGEEKMKLSEKIQEALREQQEINLSDQAVQKRLAAQWGYVPAGAQDGIRWDLLPGWLIDHHEGAVLSEELLQRALAEMLAEMPKPEVQTALRERVMDAIAEALGDAYDCTRHWSAWGYGTMSQDDFSLVADDSDRIGEIADAAIGAIGAQNAPTIAEQDQINAEAAIRSIYGAQPAPIEMSITTGALSEMFLSLDGHDKAQPGYEWRKGWNDAIRQAMDYAQPAPSVPDGWLRAIDEALVVAHIGVANAHDTYEQAKAKLDNLIGLHVDIATDPAVNGGWKLVPSVPDDIVRGSARLLKRASGHLRWLKKDTYQWQCLNPKTRRAAELLHRDIDAMLAAAPEAKP